MFLPKFLIADNDDYPENTYVVHTQSPRFILDVDTEEYEILDNSDIDEEKMANVLESAFAFYEAELERYEDEDDSN